MPPTAAVPMVTDDPAQIIWSAPASAMGCGITVMVTELESTQLPTDSATVYVVVIEGVAMGCAILVALKPVAGDQL